MAIIIKATVTDGNSVGADEQLIKDSISETRWRIGIGIVNGNQLSIDRKKTLTGFEYRYNGQIVNLSNLECWNPTEYIDWRDQ